jgi:two-component system chemotaxis response regulator CheB
MPLNAMAAAPPDLVLPARELAPALARLAAELDQMPAAEYVARKEAAEAAMSQSPPRDAFDQEAALVAENKASLETHGRHGEPSVMTCPDCGGVLWEVGEGGLLRFRCHVGHAYTAEGLRAEQASMLEGALWTAVRALEESAALARRMATRARKHENATTAEYFEARAEEDEQRAELVRQALTVSAAPVESQVNALDSGGGTGG